MILFAALAGMALTAVLCLLIPLLRPPARPPPRAEHDVEIYRDQLAEIERDRDRGLIPESQLDASRAEIGRRLLAAADARQEPAESRGASQSRTILAAVIAALLPLAAGGLYVWQGAPPGLSGPARETADAPPDMAALVERLAERMAERPGDAQGWRLLGRSLFSLERFSEAARAYRRAAELLPADADLKSLQGEALAAANRGTIAPEARRLFAAALRIDPKEPRARFYLGLAALQEGDRDEALARWRTLEADSPEDAEWLPMLRQRIAGLAPAAETGGMPPEERARAIRFMVEGLAARMKENPGDADGWARLARSWRVLGEAEREREALVALAGLLPEGSPERAAVERRIETLHGKK